MADTAQNDLPVLRGTRSPIIWSAAAALIILPVVAIRGTDAAAWDPPGDFVFLAILLLGVGLIYEFAARVSDRSSYWLGVAIAVAAALLNSWMNLFVRLVGSENSPANWVYGSVLIVAVAGAVVARLGPRGMTRTMIATAITQALAFVVALVAGLGFNGPVTVFLTSLWLVSAWLFRRAAPEQAPAAAAAI